MVPMDHDTDFDLTLESILDEYRGFDPEAPEETPLPEAAFASRVAQAELIDEGLEELLTPEALMALEDPEPAPEELPAEPEELLPPEDLFETAEPEDILTGLHSEELDEILAEIRQEPEPEPETDVRAYYPHGQDSEAEPEIGEEATEIFQSVAEPEPESPLARIKSFARRFAEVLAPEEDEPPEEEAPEELPAEEIYPDEEALPLDEQQPTQVFQAVAETFGEDLSLELPEEEAKIWAQEVGDGETVYADELPEEAYEDEEAALFGEAPEPDVPIPEEDWSEDDEDVEEYEEVERRSFEEAVVRPVVSRIAAISWRIRARREEKKEADALEEDLGPEPTARAAHRYYAAKESDLQTRSRLALIVSLVLLYLSSGLPVLGLLKNSPRVMAVMCIILQLTAMLIGLDVLTVGLTGFRHRRPGIESLVLLGCVFSLIDGALVAVLNTPDRLPFCVVSAFAVTFLLYSSFCRARGFGLTFHVLARSKEPGVLTAGLNDYYDGITLAKSKCSTDGFIYRAEEPGPDAVVFAVLTPYLIAVCVILSLLATALSGSIKNAGHIFAAIFAAAAPLAAIICYTVPFKSLAAFLQPKGLAVAGWSGAGDISRSRRFVVTDRDLFAPNTISISDPSFLQGMSEAKVVACAASLINASGCCLTPAFVELLSGYNYPLFRVDNFRCDSAGGMSGMINDEEVLLGTSEFMRLKGINASRPDIEDHTTLFVAINNELCGSFPVRYHAARSVQNALKYLLKSSERPVFAVRDPNIAPSLLKQKFRTQADGFDFPPFRQRYALSDPELGEEDPICGVVTRTGLAALLAITKTGRQLCRYVNAGLVASLALLVIGVLAMFWLCSVGHFAAGSAFHLAVYEIVAALVVPLVCYFIKR